MARPLRLEFAGALYHVTSRGNGREDIVPPKKGTNLFSRGGRAVFSGHRVFERFPNVIPDG